MLEGLADTGTHVPALEARPDIFGLEWLWQAFHTLSTCRTFGMSVGPIPWTAIHTYCLAERMNPFETRMLTYTVQAMDREYMAHANTKQSAPKRR